MGLNNSKGNMYDFVTHTWNTVKGSCPHDCGYCYMKRWGKLNPAHLAKMIKRCRPQQVNIGADSGNHKLPEPPKEKVLELIDELSKFTKVKQKANLSMLLK